MSGKINCTKLEALANGGKLNEEAVARRGHVGRFYQGISKACPNPISRSAMFSPAMSYKNSGTNDEGVSIGQCPQVR
jgi:hypothetical protein